MRRTKKKKEKVFFPISAMIDCTFLLLAFFMTTSTLHKQEADISFSLPGVARQSEPVSMPDEQIVEIMTDGSIILNSLELDTAVSRDLPELTKTLTRFREACSATKTEAMLTISAADDVPHQRVIDVLNACAVAQMNNVTFAFEDTGAL
jgi:biopolymer transport protein ExbD